VTPDRIKVREHRAMSMLPPFMRVVVILVMSLCLACCGKTETYRYKLTLAVDTPQGVKRGAGVVEVIFYDVSFPERGTMHKLRGEALYLDLGPGARPLIALLTNQLHPKYGKEQRWTRDAGPDDNLLSALYGVSLSAGILDYVSQISRMRGPRKVTPADLPDLVTFADINDPKSVIEVDPGNLQATLGPNVTWNEITLESTDEPITAGIATKLTWLPAYHGKMLDGDHYSTGNRLANTLSTADFSFGLKGNE
jgi:hypothetical protein